MYSETISAILHQNVTSLLEQFESAAKRLGKHGEVLIKNDVNHIKISVKYIIQITLFENFLAPRQY